MSKKNPGTQYTSITQEEQNASEIALIKQSLEYMKTGIDEIKESFKQLRIDFANGFVNKDQFETLRQEVNTLKEEMKEEKKFKTWAIQLALGSVLSSALAIIVALVLRGK